MPTLLPAAQPRPTVPALPMLSLGRPGLRLEIARGSYAALLGRSGAEASMLLAQLAGFAPAAGMEMLLDGRPIGRTPAHRRGVALVEPGDTLLEHLSVADNVALPLGAHGVARAGRGALVAALLDRLRLAGQAGARPRQLGAEQLVRAALARALAARPRLLLLDDPLARLAPGPRFALQDDLRRLHAEFGLTVLHATADAAEALRLADQAGVLDGGRLHQFGPPQALYDQPASALVARLTGEANFLPGRYVGEDDDLADVHLDCGIAVQARPVDARPGQRCVVAVRPERIALAAVAAEEMGEAALPATVQEVLAVGDHVRLRLIVGAPGAPAALLAVRRPAGAPLAGLTVGASAAVAWQPYHAHALLPDRDAAP